MKGTNEFSLNYETVLEAIQEYLEKRMVTAPVVKSISTTYCPSWVHGEGITNYGSMSVHVQDPVDFLEGKK